MLYRFDEGVDVSRLDHDLLLSAFDRHDTNVAYDAQTNQEERRQYHHDDQPPMPSIHRRRRLASIIMMHHDVSASIMPLLA
ncbi:hypothetical protein [Nitrospira sp. Nam74]